MFNSGKNADVEYNKKLYQELEIRFLAVRYRGLGINTGVYCMFEGNKYYVRAFCNIFGMECLTVTLVNVKSFKSLDLDGDDLKKIEWIYPNED